MIAIIITLIVCSTVIILYSIHKWWEWENPYTDEIIDKGIRKDTFNPFNSDAPLYRTGSWYEVRRTYKNGKITYKNLKL